MSDRPANWHKDVVEALELLNERLDDHLTLLKMMDDRISAIEARLSAPRQGLLTRDEEQRLFSRYEALTAGDELQAALKASEDVER